MLKVNLEVYNEQGSEGAYWCVYDCTKEGYEGLITLDNGDRLIIPSVNFDALIDKDLTSHRIWFKHYNTYVINKDFRGLLENEGWVTKEMSNEQCYQNAVDSFSQQTAGSYYCHWLQKNVDRNLWAYWFDQELPAYYIQKKNIE